MNDWKIFEASLGGFELALLRKLEFNGLFSLQNKSNLYKNIHHLIDALF